MRGDGDSRALARGIGLPGTMIVLIISSFHWIGVGKSSPTSTK
ncbi:hypothetical protein M5D96_012092, partial [Drosophila gunungcola]